MDERLTTKPRHQLRLDTLQAQVFHSKKRFRVIIGGRQIGKSHLSCVELITATISKPNAKAIYLAKTLGQAKRTIWDSLLQFAKPYILKANHSELSLLLINGSTIRCLGAEQHDALRGINVDLLVGDEIASWDKAKEIWEGVLQATLLVRNGRALFVTSPKGYNFAYDLFQLGQGQDADWQSWRFKTSDCPRITSEMLDVFRRTNDPRLFDQEYNASFVAAVGIVYDSFDVNKHVRRIEDNGSQVYAGIDFNVNPLSCAIVQNSEAGKFVVLENLETWGSTTQELADTINTKYAGRVTGCPDPTGRFRRTNGPTDVQILEKAGIPCPAWAPIAITDKTNNLQANLLNAAGEISLFVHPRCTKLIKCLSSLEWGSNSEPDKKSQYAHMTDALAYAMWHCNNLFEQPATVSQMRLH